MKRFVIRVLPLTMVLLLFLVANSFSQIPKPMKNTYVNDYAGVLTKSQIQKLNVQIHKLERITNVQLAIVLVNKLPKEYEIEDYSLLIARKWQVGQNQRGLVYVAAIKQRKQRLEVSRNLDTVFDDGVNSQILDDVKPYFKQADYNGGLLSMVAAITDTGKPAVIHKEEPVVSSSDSKTEDTSVTILTFLIIIIPLYFICRLIYLFIRGLISRNNPQAGTNYGYNNQQGNRSYQQPSGGGGGPSSGLGAGVGGFIAGAATGYAARTLQDHMSENNSQQSEESYSSSPSYQTPINESDDNSSDYGSWGSRSSGGSSSSSSSSSSGGYSGSGTTSDW